MEFDVQRFGRVFPVNAGAPSALIQVAVPLLSERRGLIVNITSDAAHAAYPGWGPYGASKAALELLTRTLAAELRDRGVSAVVVDPGDMRSHQEARFLLEDISIARTGSDILSLVVRSETGGRQRRAIRGPAGGRPMAATGVIADFELSAGLEATEPPEARGLRRDEVRLLVSDVETDSIEHARFTDLPRWLSAGDLLVVNASGTLNAAVSAKAEGGEPFEIHLSTRLPGGFGASKCDSPAQSRRFHTITHWRG
jgi:hypothetical protein